MRLRALLTLAVLSLLPVLSRANDIEPTKEFYDAYRMPRAVTLDGLLTEWTGLPVTADPKFAIRTGAEGTAAGKGSGGVGATYVLFERYNGGNWTGPDDQTSAVQVAWDDNNIYFGFVVTDEYHEDAANSAWNGDSIQLMIANAARNAQVALYNYALGGIETDPDLNDPSHIIINHEAGPGTDPANATEAVVRRDTANKKTIYEIKLPAAALGLTAPLTAGTKFGLGMAINDGDETTPGQKGWGGLGAHSIVFGKTPSETALVTLTTNLPGADAIFFSAINPTIGAFSFRANDKGAAIVAPASAKLIIDGQTVTLVASPKVGDATDFKYTPAASFPANSTHTYTIEVQDTRGITATSTGTFVTPSYALLTSANKVTADTTKPGFIWNVHQNDALQANDNTRPVLQLAGILGQNFADPNAQGVAIAPGTPGANNTLPVRFEIDSVINMDQAGTPIGGIQDPADGQMPGIPGTSGNGMNGIAGEIITYIDLPVGSHTFIVNSDDGFRTTAGSIDVFKAQLAGEFNGGRGAADTPYTIVVQDAGVYPFRTVWQEGGGGANIEWKTVKADGTHVLLNDTANGGFPTFRAVTAPQTAVISAVPPVNSTGNAGDTPIAVIIQEGANAVDLGSVRISLNGGAANTVTPTKNGNIIIAKFQPAALLPPNSTNSATLTYSAGGTSRTETWTFTVANYVVLTADLKVTPDTSKPGFIWNVHQNDGFQANNNQRPLDQLAGVLGENFADPAAQGIAIAPGTPGANNRLPIKFEIDTVLNLDQSGGSNGEFQPDDQMPGIPGTSGNGLNGIAGEAITYIEVPAGKNTFIVNSDDGFRTTAGNFADVIDAKVLGEFNGGRGAADTAYTFYTEQAGVYAFRTVWQEGGGGANIEWKYVKPDGSHVLINDTANGGPKAYRAITGAGAAAPTITRVTPAVNATKAAGSTAIEVVVQEGSTQIDQASVQLTIDGVAAAPVSFTRAGNIVTLRHQPSAALAAGVSHTARIRFTYGGTERVATWSFRVPPSTLDKTHQYIGLVLGTAKFTPDSGGHTGVAGDFAIDLGPAGGTTPSVLIPDASWINASASNDVLTYSIWVKKYDNANSSVFWSDSGPPPSNVHAFQAHTPWSDNVVYFDTAGCCTADETRISQPIADFAGFTGPAWWTDLWHHWVFVKNGNTDAAAKKIYIDGELFDEGGGNVALPTDFVRIWLGAEGGGPDAGTANNMHGLIDDFAVFGSALTPAQIQQLKNGTAPTGLPAGANLLAFWDFNDAAGGGGGNRPVISISQAGNNVNITWTNGGNLQSATSVLGPWTTVDSDGSYSTATSGAAMFFRVQK